MATELAADEIDQLCASYHGASPGKPIEGDRDDRD
jgi:hypothetical protein